MSSRKRRVVTKRLRDKGKLEWALFKLVLVVLLILILNAMINRWRDMPADGKWIFENSQSVLTASAAEASNFEAPDPCTLKEVICHHEEVKTTQSSKYEASEGVEEILRATFSDDPETAVKIATCESSLIANKIGDGHLAFEHDGELLGRSIGVLMVRTGGNEGGKVWNRAKANGMSVEAFEKKMQKPEENIKYAHEIYKRSGNSWRPWYNCAKKVGAI